MHTYLDEDGLVECYAMWMLCEHDTLALGAAGWFVDVCDCLAFAALVFVVLLQHTFLSRQDPRFRREPKADPHTTTIMLISFLIVILLIILMITILIFLLLRVLALIVILLVSCSLFF